MSKIQKRKKMRIAMTSHYLSWLGLDSLELMDELHKIGYEVASIDFDTEPSDPVSSRVLPPILFDTLRYVLSIEMEYVVQNVGELDSLQLKDLWSIKLASMYKYCETLLKRNEIDLVIIVQGFEPINAATRAAAINLNIPILAIENTALNTKLVWDNLSGVTTNRNLSSNYYWRYKGTIEKHEIDRYVDLFKTVLISYKSEEHTSPGNELAKCDDRPTVVFLGQVLTDSAVIFGLNGWDSPFQILKQLIKWCNKKGFRLIVKLHPKESHGSAPITNKPYNKVTYRRLREDQDFLNELADNHGVIDSSNNYCTYRLILDSSIVVTLNSQAGLESAFFRKPTVVCGTAFYSGFGFTIDAPLPCQLEASLDFATKFTVSDAVDEFLYILYERYCIDKRTSALVGLISARSFYCS